MIDLVGVLESAASRLVESAVPDSLLADVAGRVRAVEVKLGDWRRGMENQAVGLTATSDPEEQHVSTGEAFRLVPTVVIVRTYNTPGILAGVADATGRSIVEVLRSAIDAGAVKLDWSYRAMVKWVKRSGAMLTTASGEVPSESDLGEPMIREIEKAGRPKRVPVDNVEVAAERVAEEWPGGPPEEETP
jgi:hypothetical protein